MKFPRGTACDVGAKLEAVIHVGKEESPIVPLIEEIYDTIQPSLSRNLAEERRRTLIRGPASPARKFRSRHRLRTTSSPRDEFPTPNNRAARRRFGYVFAICNEYRFKKN